MRVGQTSAIYFGSNVLATVIAFIATIYFTRTLPESVLGQYFLVVAILTWASVVLGRPFQSAVTKRLSESDDPAFLTAGFVIQSAAFVVFSALLFVFEDAVNAYLGLDAALAVALLLFASLSFKLIKASLQGERRTHVAAMLQPVDFGVRSLVQVAGVAAGIGLFGLLFGYGIALVVASVAGLAFLQSRPAIPDRSHFRRLFSFARYSWLGKVSNRAFASMDTLVLGLFVAKSFVTYYEIAWNLASIFAIFGVGISQTLFPEISKLAVEDNTEQVETLVEDSLAYAGLFLVPGLVGSIAVGDLVLRVYNEQYAIAADVLVLLVGARLVYAYGSQLTNALSGLDRPDLAFKVNLGFVLVNIVLNVVLVSTYGWVGAAVATGVSAVTTLALGYWYLSDLLTVTVPFSEILTQWVAAALMGAAVVLARQVAPTNWQAGFVLALAGGAVYFGLLYGLSARFRSTLQDNVPVL